MANHQTNFTSNFGEMGETGNAAFVLNVNGVSHTYHPVGSDVSVDVATVRRILATAPNLAQSIAAVLTASGYPILVYDGSEYGYIKTANNRYVFTCLDSLNGVKQAEVDTQDGTITAGTGGVDGVSILTRADSDLFVKITTSLELNRIPIILDNGVYYHLIAKTSAVAQFGRITAAGALEVLTVNSSDQIVSSSFTFVQDPYYVHTDNNFTDAYKTAVEANTADRHTHTNKSILDSIKQTDIDNWDGKLSPIGNASDTTSTFTKASGDTSTTVSGSELSAIFTAISSFFASLKALAFKDKASYNDLSSSVQASLDKANSALQAAIEYVTTASAWQTLETAYNAGKTLILRVENGTDWFDEYRITAVNESTGSDRFIFCGFPTMVNLDGGSVESLEVTEWICYLDGDTTRWVTTTVNGLEIPTKDYVTQAIQNISSFKYESIGNTAVDLNDKLYANECHAYVWTYANRNNVANKPTNDGGIVLSFAYYTTAYGAQIAMDGNDNEKPLFVRFKVADQWGNWIPLRDASWINSGTFGTNRIADDAITADKVKDNETLPVNVSGTATHLSAYGLWDTWAVGSYNSAKPYVDIAEVLLDLSSNNGASELFQLEFGNTDITRFRLDFKINGGNVDRSNVIILESTWSKSALSNRLSVSYFKYDNDTKLAIRIYIKFTALWEVFRIRQLDAQTGDSGYIDWKAARLYSGRGEGVSSPVGTNATIIYNLVHTNNAAVGSSSTPVYVDVDGQVQPCSSIELGVPKHSATITSGAGVVTYTSPADTFVVAVNYDRANSRAYITVNNATGGRTLYVSLNHSNNLTPVAFADNVVIVGTTSEYNLFDLDILCMGIGDELPVYSFTVGIYVNESKCTYTVYDKMLYHL